MPIKRLNHAVLFVRDAKRSAEFYKDVFGFEVRGEIGGGQAVFLVSPESGNDHDLGLFSIGDGAAASEAGRRTVGLYHLAWQVETLAELERMAGVLSERGALVGASDHVTTKSLYGADPDGIEFEVMWPVPQHLVTDEMRASVATRPLDLEREKERYGATTVSA